MKMNAQSVGTVLLVAGAVIIGVFGVNPDNNQEGANAIKPAKQTVLTQEEVKRIGHTSKPVAAGSLPRARTTRLPIFHTKASPFAAASPSRAPKVVGQAAPTVAAEETNQPAAAVLLEEKAVEEKVGNELGVEAPFLSLMAGLTAHGPLPSGSVVNHGLQPLRGDTLMQPPPGAHRWEDLRGGMASNAPEWLRLRLEVTTGWLRSLEETNQVWDAEAYMDADALEKEITRLEEVVHEIRRMKEGVYKVDNELYDKNWAPALEKALQQSLTQLQILQHYSSAQQLAQALQESLKAADENTDAKAAADELRLSREAAMQDIVLGSMSK